MKFECPGCGHRFVFDDELAGWMFSCTSCGTQVQASDKPPSSEQGTLQSVTDSLVWTGKSLLRQRNGQADARAFVLFSQAAEAGSAEAQICVGYFHHVGRGIPKDLTKAAMCYERAAAFCLSVSEGGVGDGHVDALQWYRDQAEKGAAPTETRLDYLYYGGDMCLQDYTDVVLSFVNAEPSTMTGTMALYLGMAYRDGKGVPGDCVEALAWFKRGAVRSCKQADDAFSELEARLTSSESEAAYALYRKFEALGENTVSTTKESSLPQVDSLFVADAPVLPATGNPIVVRLASIGKVAGGFLLWIVCLAVILLILIFGGKFAIRVDPWTEALAGLSLLLVVPLSLILLIFRRTRGYGGLGIYLASWPVGLSLWISCIAYAVSVSVFWTIIGIMMGGLGIVPIAAILTLLRKDWWGFGTIIAMVAITWVLRVTGMWIASKSLDQSIELSNAGRAKRCRPFVAVLRWIVVLPASFLSYLAVNVVIIFYTYMVNHIGGGSHNHFSQYANTVLPPIAFVYIGTITAPSRHSAAAIGLTVLHAVIMAACVGFAIHAGTSGYYVNGVSEAVICALVGIVCSVICCILIIQRDPARLLSEEQATAVS